MQWRNNKIDLRRILFVWIFFNSVVAYSQNSLAFDDCKARSFCMDCGNPKAEFNSNKTLFDYFKSELSIYKTMIKKVNGQIDLQIIVDTLGQVCCKNISNNSNMSLEDVRELKLNEIVAKMPLWSPAVGKKGKATSAIILSLKFKEKEGLETVERQGLSFK